MSGTGRQPQGASLQLQIAGRVGVPPDASAVILNVTSTEAATSGFVTVHPRGTPRPTTSNLNYVAGQTIPNAVITALGPSGEACLYTHGATHLVVDVAGYITGPPPATTGPDCPHTTPSASTDEVRNTLLQYPTIYPALGEDRIAECGCASHLPTRLPIHLSWLRSTTT